MEKLAGSFLEKLVVQNGYSQRLLRISQTQLPLVAEVYDQGKLELRRIVAFQPERRPGLPPLFIIEVEEDDGETMTTKTVDIGQITTVWEESGVNVLRDLGKEQRQKATRKFPVHHAEKAMQNLYASFNNCSKLPSSMAKKRTKKLVETVPEEIRVRATTLLGRLVKTGTRMNRLLDSSIAMDYLWRDYPSDEQETLVRRAVGAKMLAEDAALGGRFKRWSCLYISSEVCDGVVTEITFLNGGWIVMDKSVRAGTEARKFVERNTADKDKVTTAADERIVQRLECLAMGDVFSKDRTFATYDNLEMDVRETLRTMSLSPTPDGARQALVRLGRWSYSEMNSAGRLEPWSRETLEAAKWYHSTYANRRIALAKQCNMNRKRAKETSLGGRIDLTHLPCVSVDRKSTAFRDDAIGLRERKRTGRKVIDRGGRWEILLHVVDVSDIYVPSPPNSVLGNRQKLGILRAAAESRGSSRYDLPFGPMHLIPPILSRALSFKTRRKPGDRNQPNRCVTLWVYLNLESGKILDAGLERTLVSSPYSLSYEDATDLLANQLSQDPPLYIVQGILTIADKALGRWTDYNLRHNKVASVVEDRLAVREMIANQRYSGVDCKKDFGRSRGQRMVDAALNLYSYGLTSLLERAKAPIPRASGGRRLGTAPLRRYIDGIAQRQALAVLCQYGGPKMTWNQCRQAQKLSDQAQSRINTVRAAKRVPNSNNLGGYKQVEALRMLESELQQQSRSGIPAVATGRENLVVIRGSGATATCRRVKGTLKPGQEVEVQVDQLVPEKGILVVSLVGVN